MSRRTTLEASVLGAMMIDNELTPAARAALTVGNFAEEAHQTIFRALLIFDEKRLIANPMTLRPVLRGDPALEEIGGVAYLANIAGVGPAALIAFDALLAALKRLPPRPPQPANDQDIGSVRD